MSRPRPKVPRRPPDRLTKEPGDVVDYTGILWRVHRTTGEHVRPWNELRTYGPLPSMRWDPHPGRQPDHPDGVLYAASDVTTTLAEVYQPTLRIDTRAGVPRLTAWEPTRPLQLLDLSGTWLLRNAASAALLAAPRSICRRWARAIYATWPELDGLHAPSAMTGRINVILWTASADAMPAAPAFSRPLEQPLVWSLAQAAAVEIGYQIV